MKRWTHAMLVAAMVVGAVALSGGAVSAEVEHEEQNLRYAEAMWYFVPQLGRYALEVERTLDAVRVKPELAATLDDLAKRGEFIVYDLDGTPAPAEMAAAHDRLTAALRQYMEAAQIGAQDPDGARYLVNTYAPMLQQARGQIRGWLMTRGTLNEAPAAPVKVAGQ